MQFFYMADWRHASSRWKSADLNSFDWLLPEARSRAGYGGEVVGICH